MAKKTYQISTTLNDLVECIVDYAECIKDEYENKTSRRSFTLDTPQQKYEAIMSILFGDHEVSKNCGNRSFKEVDKNLLIKIKKERELEGKKTERKALIEACLDHVETRTEKPDWDGIKTRLKKAYKELEEINWQQCADYDYGELSVQGFEEYIQEDLNIISPWLDRYKEDIMQYLSNSTKSKKSIAAQILENSSQDIDEI